MRSCLSIGAGINRTCCAMISLPEAWFTKLKGRRSGLLARPDALESRPTDQVLPINLTLADQ